MSDRIECVVDCSNIARRSAGVGRGGAGALLGRYRGQAAAALYPGDPGGGALGDAGAHQPLCAARGRRAHRRLRFGHRPLRSRHAAASTGSRGPTQSAQPLQRRKVRSQRPLLGRHHGRPASATTPAVALPRRSRSVGPSQPSARSAFPTASSGRWRTTHSTSPTVSTRWSIASTTIMPPDRIHNRRRLRRHEHGGEDARTAAPSMRKASSGSPTGTAGAWSAMRRTARIDRIVEMPVQKPTSCMFGGPDLARSMSPRRSGI